MPAKESHHPAMRQTQRLPTTTTTTTTTTTSFSGSLPSRQEDLVSMRNLCHAGRGWYLSQLTHNVTLTLLTWAGGLPPSQIAHSPESSLRGLFRCRAWPQKLNLRRPLAPCSSKQLLEPEPNFKTSTALPQGCRAGGPPCSFWCLFGRRAAPLLDSCTVAFLPLLW